MTRPHARAGAPYVPPMDCRSAGCNAPQSECLGMCLRRVEPSQIKPLPVEMHEPDLSLRDKFIQLIKGDWKCE